MTVMRTVDVSHLTEEEITKILGVLTKDIHIRKSEKERSTYLNKKFTELRREIYVANSRRKARFDDYCLICGKHLFTFCCFVHLAEECLSCEHFCCTSCRSNCVIAGESKRHYLCNLCIHKRLLKCITSEWFFELVQKRFKRFGSAKVLRAIYKQRKLIEPRVITLLALCRELPPARFLSIPPAIRTSILTASQDDVVVSYSNGSSNLQEAHINIDYGHMFPRKRHASESEIDKVNGTTIDLGNVVKSVQKVDDQRVSPSIRAKASLKDGKGNVSGNMASPKIKHAVMEACGGVKVDEVTILNITDGVHESLPLLSLSLEDNDEELSFVDRKKTKT